jgi:hypothetical protein
MRTHKSSIVKKKYVHKNKKYVLKISENILKISKNIIRHTKKTAKDHKIGSKTYRQKKQKSIYSPEYICFFISGNFLKSFPNPSKITTIFLSKSI